MAIPVDFKGVESGGGRTRVPEGDYLAKVTSVKQGESKSSGNPMLTWEFVGVSGKLKGKKLKDYTTLTAESLWKLKGLLESLGFRVPSKKIDLAPILKKAIGKELGLTLVDEEYENKMSSKIAGYLSTEELEDDSDDEEDDSDDEEQDEGEDEEDEEPQPKSKKKKSNKKGSKARKGGDDEDSDDDEIEDLDLDEL